MDHVTASTELRSWRFAQELSVPAHITRPDAGEPGDAEDDCSSQSP